MIVLNFIGNLGVKLKEANLDNVLDINFVEFDFVNFTTYQPSLVKISRNLQSQINIWLQT